MTDGLRKVFLGDATCTNGFFNIDPYIGFYKQCVVEYPPPYISPGGLKFMRTKGVAVPCAPAPKGYGTIPVIDVNGAGITFGWWCKVPAPEYPVLNLYAVQWWAFDSVLVGKLIGVLFASDHVAAIKALAAERASVPIDKLYDVWGPAESRLIASRPEN